MPLLLLAPLLGALAPAPDVDFARDVRPILAASCVRCHGPKKQKAGLRLDRRAAALAGSYFGENPVIVPGSAADSLLYRLVASEDPFDRMPAEEDPLPAEQVELLRRWIDEGAVWPADAAAPEEDVERHWAYVAPVRPTPPAVADEGWPRDPLDRFVLARLEREGLAPAPEADLAVLARRASLDLTGLPPSVAEVDALLVDARPDAYERYVDRLLASPRYGEHMARRWLDLARYADTDGYEKDERRTMWRWRDWVIDAFNADMSFDRFTVEQLAGDLLPDATLAQRIATGFHRNTMTNREGGTDPEEFRAAAVVDRVNTTASVWLGTTMACAQCHNHKYDPFSQREYFELYAFFDGTADTGNEAAPMVRAPTAEQSARLAFLEREIGRIEEALVTPAPELDAAQAVWEAEARAQLPPPVEWRAIAPTSALSRNGARLEPQDDGSLLATGASPERDVYELVLLPGAGTVRALRLEALADERLPNGGPGRAPNGNFVLGGIELELASTADPTAVRPLALAAADADYSQRDDAIHFRPGYALDPDPDRGWAVAGEDTLGVDHEALFTLAVPLELDDTSLLRVRLRHESRYALHALGRFRLSLAGTGVAPPVERGPWRVVGPFPDAAQDTVLPPEREHLARAPYSSEYADGGLAWRVDEALADRVVHPLEGERSAWFFARELRTPVARGARLWLGSDDGVKVWLNGALVHANPSARAAAPDQDEVRVDLPAGASELLVEVVNQGGPAAFCFDLEASALGGLPPAVAAALRTGAVERTPEQRGALRAHFRRFVSEAGRGRFALLQGLRDEREALLASVPSAMVMQELDTPRETHVHVRGSFLNPGERVRPDVPNVLHPFPEGAPRDRLGLAEWLMSRDNPLTARVTANRLWEQLFGVGLVATSADFGTRGDAPTHPELLDWLALGLVDGGWSVKSFLRTLVCSATYRQSARITPELLARDPQNRRLARAPRPRLAAEAVRDAALAIAGLLEPEVGGPSVFPPQPEGIWAATYNADRWTTATDAGRWRRGLYTFWRRTAPYPTYLLFDAPSRELVCTRRARSNTPLQALALLNDPVFVEAAVGLARRMVAEGGATPAERAAHGLRLCVARRPRAGEVDALVALFDAERARFKQDPAAAQRLLMQGPPAGDAPAEPVELAAWTVVANALLNLDETITRN